MIQRRRAFIGEHGQIQEGTWKAVLWLTIFKQEKGEEDSCEGYLPGHWGRISRRFTDVSGSLYVSSVVSDSVTPWTVATSLLLPGGVLQARILESVAISFSSRSFPPRDWTRSLAYPALAGDSLPLVPPGSTHWSNKERGCFFRSNQVKVKNWGRCYSGKLQCCGKIWCFQAESDLSLIHIYSIAHCIVLGFCRHT